MRKVIKVFVEELNDEGRGVGKVGNREVIIDYVVPGDFVEVKIESLRGKGRRKAYYGKVISVLSEGEGRVKPRCAHFGVCGGCRFQNWRYDYQLKFKLTKVLRAAEKWKVNCELLSPIASPVIWYYRNRMDYAISYDAKVGLKEYGSWRNILDLSECYLMSKEAFKITRLTKDFMLEYKVPGWDLIQHKGFLRYVVIREGKFTDDRLVNYITWGRQFKYLNNLVSALVDSKLVSGFVWGINPTVTDVSVAKELRYIWGKDHLTEKIYGYVFHIHPNAFFQTNSYQTVALAGIVRKLASGGELLLDLYAGVGLFSVLLSDQYSNIYGIEVEECAVTSGEITLKWNDISNVKYITGRVEDFLHIFEGRKVDTIIVDPPRPGMSNKVIRGLLKLEPREIIYVSCNPDTMFRDISMLLEKFAVDDHIYPLDMFPHTPHIEVVAKLVRR